MKPLRDRHFRLLALLKAAAREGVECPTNRQLAAAVGLSKPNSLVPYFWALEEHQLIRVERFAADKRVTIVETGDQTFVPKSGQVTHWRDREKPPLSAAKAEKGRGSGLSRKSAKEKADSGFQPLPCPGAARGKDGAMIVPPFEPFTAEQAETFAESLADGFTIETAARHARRSLLDGYRHFHGISEELGERL